MRGIVLSLCLCIALAVATVSAASGRSVLVLVDDLQIRNTHSSFFRSLEESGYELHYHEATNPHLQLAEYGEYLYDSLIIFAPHTEAFGDHLEVDSILNFIDDGHNVLIGVDGLVSDPIREIALECGVEFGDSETMVIDHLNFDASDVDGDHTLVISDAVINASVITGNVEAPLLFRGIGLSLEADNQLLIPILRASSTAFVHAPDAHVVEQPKILGQDTVLLAALQARNNARVTFSGSLEFFSDKFFNSPVQRYQADSAGRVYPRSGNGPLSAALASWTFGSRGVLRATNIRHNRVGETTSPRVYTIKEQLAYHVDLEEWDGRQWVPYVSSDVPLEFVRIDPHERVYLQKEGAGATYGTSFQIPDVYGIFTLRLNYHRLGYTSFTDNTKVTVRPLKHNQYERFIFSAYPYYASAFSMMFGVLLFSLVFLYNKDRPRQPSKK